MAGKGTTERIEKDLECPVCLDVFENARCLSCLHTFCEECIEDISDGDLEVTCPECRELTLLNPATRAAGLKLNIVVNRLAETLKKKRSAGESPRFVKKSASAGYGEVSDSQQVCGQHGIGYKYFCKECRVPICSECVMESHVAHIGEVCSLGALADEKKVRMEEQLRESELELQRQRDIIRTLDGGCQRGIVILGQAAVQYKSHFDRHFSQLVSHKRAFNAETGRLKRCLEGMVEKRLSINSLGQDLVEHGDTEEITATYQQWAEALTDIPLASDSVPDASWSEFEEGEKTTRDLANKCLECLKELTGLLTEIAPSEPNESEAARSDQDTPRAPPHRQASDVDVTPQPPPPQTRMDGPQIHNNEENLRRTQFRVSGLPESEGEDTNQLIVGVVRERLGVEMTEQDIAWTKRIGPPPPPGMASKWRARPILAKLHSFEKKRTIMRETIKLKDSGVSLYEELSRECYALLREVFKHPRVVTAWTVGGVINATVKEGDGTTATKCVPNREALGVL